jgi:PPK2 family polyphosphate:nucleotide phosphotransferase
MNKALTRLASAFRHDSGKGFKLASVKPGDTLGFKKEDAAAVLEKTLERLRALQEKLYADNRWAILVVFQAMDAAGKDSAIKHVMRGLNAQGGHVFPFKAPTGVELEHDFLWRAAQRLPAHGDIHIFNRSYYEEVLVVRVRPELLAAQGLPESCRGKTLWTDRFHAINAFEHHLTRNGTVVIKFFLHVSREEQKKRFLERIDRPEKNWKFSSADAKERSHWDRYIDVYEDCLRHTSTKHAPWYVIPADNKWVTRAAVANVLYHRLKALKLQYPQVGADQRAQLEDARKMLMAEK